MKPWAGWVLVCAGIVLFVLACVGISFVIFLWSSDFMKGIVG